jgi:hypothetical protein
MSAQKSAVKFTSQKTRNSILFRQSRINNQIETFTENQLLILKAIYYPLQSIP